MKFTSKKYAKEIIDDSFQNKRIIISERDKNYEFMKKYGITKVEAEEIVKSLTVDMFKEKIKNKDKKIKTEYLYVFLPLLSLNDEYGLKIKKCIYKNM